MSNQIKVSVGNSVKGLQDLTAFTHLQITKSLGQFAHSFGFKTSAAGSFAIEKGDDVFIKINDTFITSGYVNGIKISLNTTTVDVEFAGRSHTGDLIDTTQQIQYEKGKLLSVAQGLCQPYGITVSVADNAPTDAVAAPQLQQGTSSVFEALLPICQAQGFLLLTDPHGDVVLTKNPKAASGVVIKAPISVDYNDPEEQFSTYTFKTLKRMNQKGASATLNNPTVRRYRPYTAINGGEGNPPSYLYTQALIKKRRGNPFSITVTVKGWSWALEDGTTGLWAINTIYALKTGLERINGQYLCETVQFTLSPTEGQHTVLTLVLKDKYSVED